MVQKETPPPAGTDEAGNAHVGKTYPIIRPNKQYWDEIDAEMADMVAKGKKPRIMHALEAMHRKGNADYVRAFPKIKLDVRQDSFSPVYTLHEITHVAGRIGHTPDQEFSGMAMELGILYGPALKDAHPSQLAVHKKLMAEAQNYYKVLWQNAHHDGANYTPMSKRNMAVYSAAGMYLRQKIDAYIEGCEGLRYDAQRDFCHAYEKADSTPVKPAFQDANKDDRIYFEQLQRAPYDLLKLSKAEWRAIEGVALGIHQPDQTPYPQRMEAIKQALVKAELFFDKPAFAHSPEVEKIARTHIEKQQHAKIGATHSSWEEAEAARRTRAADSAPQQTNDGPKR